MELMIAVTFGALAVSILLAYLLVHFTKSKDEFQRGAIISISLAIFVSILFLRHEAGKLVEPIDAAAKALNQERVSAALINYSNTKELLSSSPNNVMYEALELRFKEFKKAVDRVSRTGILEVSLADLEVIALSVVKSANRSIQATSYVNSSQWWKTPWGKKYFRLNEEKIHDGIIIDRIFIFEDEAALKKDMDLLVCSEKIGVNVHVLLLSDLPKPFGEDVIIIDDNVVAGQLVFGPTKEMKASNFSSNQEFIRDRLSTYETAELNAEPFHSPSNEVCSLYALENGK